MPIYEYVCRACGHETEVMHKISDPPARDCPECSKPALEKQVSPAGFRLSGGGWYETDFKKGGKRNLAGGSADKKEAPAAKEAGKPAAGDGAGKPAGGKAEAGAKKAASAGA